MITLKTFINFHLRNGWHQAEPNILLKGNLRILIDDSEAEYNGTIRVSRQIQIAPAEELNQEVVKQLNIFGEEKDLEAVDKWDNLAAANLSNLEIQLDGWRAVGIGHTDKRTFVCIYLTKRYELIGNAKEARVDITHTVVRASKAEVAVAFIQDYIQDPGAMVTCIEVDKYPGAISILKPHGKELEHLPLCPIEWIMEDGAQPIDVLLTTFEEDVTISAGLR